MTANDTDDARPTGSVVDMTGMLLDEPGAEAPAWLRAATVEAERLELAVVGLCHALDLEDWEGFRSLAVAYTGNMLHGLRTADTRGAAEDARNLAALLRGVAIAVPFADRLLDELVRPLQALATAVEDAQTADGEAE